MNGVCRWCYELTASLTTRWHRYCLNAYRVASGQHPDEIQHRLCEICGNPSDEMDHRLAIEVAKTPGPAAMLHAFTPDNLRWLCRGCHKRKTRQDRRLAKFLSACSLDWHSARRFAHAEPQVAAVVSAAVQPGIFSVADKPELMTVPCRHEVPDSSGATTLSARNHSISLHHGTFALTECTLGIRNVVFQ